MSKAALHPRGTREKDGHWFRLVAATDLPLPNSCDVVVVGAGLAGLEIAKELGRSGARDVLVLEAGPADDLRHVNTSNAPHEALRMWLEPGSDRYFRQPWRSRTPPHYAGSSGLRQRLGGRSLYWYGVVLPIEVWALAEPWWPPAVVSDLTEVWRDGPPLYRRVNQLLSEWQAQAPWGPLRQAVPEAAIGPLALKATPTAIRQSATHRGRWHAYSPLDAWRDPESGEVLRQPTTIRLRANVEVLEVDVCEGTARGVIVRATTGGERRRIDAEAVVLAAGTLENSRLAIQARAAANLTDSPRLTGLCDHIVQGFFLRLESQQASRLLEQAPPGSYFAPCAGARSILFLDISMIGPRHVLVDLRLSGEQLPSTNSYVDCSPSTEIPWSMTVHALAAPEDLLVIEEQRQILQEAWNAIGRSVGQRSATLKFGDYGSLERTNAFVLPESLESVDPGTPVTWWSALGTEDHEGGTLPLGGVVGENHELLGIRRLYAAGPCTFPRSGAANPSLTTLALAHRLAAFLAGWGHEPQTAVPRSAAADRPAGAKR